MIPLILKCFALVLFIIAFFYQPPDPPRWRGNLGWLGLAFWVGSELFGIK